MIKLGDYWTRHLNQWVESRCSCLSLDRDRLAVYPSKPMLTSSPSYWQCTHPSFSRFVGPNMTTSFLSYVVWQVQCFRVSCERRQPELVTDTNLTWSISGFIICAGVSVSVSTFNLVAISLERYSALCNPLTSRSWQTKSHAARVITATWVASFILMLPYPIFSTLKPFTRRDNSTGHMCRLVWPTDVIQQSWWDENKCIRGSCCFMVPAGCLHTQMHSDCAAATVAHYQFHMAPLLIF